MVPGCAGGRRELDRAEEEVSFVGRAECHPSNSRPGFRAPGRVTLGHLRRRVLARHHADERRDAARIERDPDSSWSSASALLFDHAAR